MATATELPKLKWERYGDRGWKTDPHDGPVFHVYYVPSTVTWYVTRLGIHVGSFPRVDGAKSIAQAFADSEAFRGAAR